MVLLPFKLQLPLQQLPPHNLHPRLLTREPTESEVPKDVHEDQDQGVLIAIEGTVLKLDHVIVIVLEVMIGQKGEDLEAMKGDVIVLEASKGEGEDQEIEALTDQEAGETVIIGIKINQEVELQTNEGLEVPRLDHYLIVEKKMIE